MSRGSNFGSSSLYKEDFISENFEYEVEHVNGDDIAHPSTPPCFPCLCEDCNCNENGFEKLQCNSNGPIILIDKTSKNSIIISSYSNHFRQNSQFLLKDDYTDLSSGHLGSFGSQKESFKIILQYSNKGIHDAIDQWGMASNLATRDRNCFRTNIRNA